MKLAIVGATGLVGYQILKVIAERNFKIDELFMIASPRSVGKTITYLGKDYVVMGMQDGIDANPDIAIFSAGGDTSLEWAPKYAKAGATVIDNSSAWRMSPDHKLIIPEVNSAALTKKDKIIANPNCSTIQMVMALAPLHMLFGLKRIVVSTYQSVTGTGKAAVDQLMNERAGKKGKKVYPHPIDMNAIPHIDVFMDNDYTKEEMKMINETRKILDLPDLPITATAVRLPVIGGHAESVNIELEKDFDLVSVKEALESMRGVVVQDDVANNVYPMPIYAQDKDEVFVGRIRRDDSIKNGLNLWIVADNLRKGAATNAIQIAEFLVNSDRVR